MQDLYSVIEKLPPDLQTKVYDYALTLAREAEPDELVLNMHKGALGIAEDFDAPLPESFWLGDT